MQDTELYQHLLGVSAPWQVVRVELRVAEGSVDVFVEQSTKELPCPTCGVASPVHDHTPSRSWRHLDSCQFRTLLHARPPRVRCKEHGVHQVSLPWSEARSRFTAMFERFAIDILRQTSIAGACAILRISWDEAFGIMRRAVARGLLRREQQPVKYVGVDEKAIRKGHKYFTVVSDLERSAVLWVGDDRKTETLDSFWRTWSVEQRAQVQAVAMDMWPAFFTSTANYLPDGESKIVFDRFHIMQHANKCVDDVRRSESFALARQGDRTLDKTRWFWLYAHENVPTKDAARFAELRRITLSTGKAWMLKEDLRWLWSQVDHDAGKAFAKRWLRWAKAQLLRPVQKLASLVKSHLPNILTYFAHRITNAGSESVNAIIDKVKRRAAGYRNVGNFKAAIYFHCGGLNLYPATCS